MFSLDRKGMKARFTVLNIVKTHKACTTHGPGTSAAHEAPAGEDSATVLVFPLGTLVNSVNTLCRAGLRISF